MGESIHIQDPNPVEKQSIIQAVAENDLLYWTRGEHTVGILADSLTGVQISGFGYDDIPVSKNGREKEMFTIYLTDSEDEIDLDKIYSETGRVVRGVVPMVVGREDWRVGLALQSSENEYGGALLLLDVLNLEDSKTVVDVLREKGEIGVNFRGLDRKNKISRSRAMDDIVECVGEEVDLSEVWEDIQDISLSSVPGGT